MVVLGVRASIGEIMMTAAQQIGSNGHVHGLESMRSLFSQLTEHLSMNGMHQVAPISKGLSGRIGTPTLGYKFFIIARKARLFRMDGADLAGTRNAVCVPGGGGVP